MIRSVLLDLDDTLLLYPEGSLAFVQSYLELAEAFFGAAIAKDMIGGVKASIQNLDPTQTNEAVFLCHLPAGLDLSAFYAEAYPQLQSLTRPNPDALPLIQKLQEKGYQVIIATNPLYPEVTIQMRLAWAGLAGQSFARVTHSQNSHFTKPHPHYYEEIMAHLSLEPYEAIMVGDHPKNDLQAAAKTGMKTFWINPQADPPLKPDGQGTLADFRDCVEQNWLENLRPSHPQAAHMPPRLCADVAALFGTLGTIPEHFWHQHPDPKEWSPMEIVHHLMSYEREIERPNFERIVSEENPFIRPPQLPPQPFELDLQALNGWELAHTWATERAETIAYLESLPPEAWERPARHSLYGLTTLLDMTVLATRHDQLHIRQLCQTLGKCE